MKRLIFTLAACLMLGAVIAQDNFYWAVYHFEVKPGHEAEVVSSFDRFFASETGKALPAANLGGVLFSSSKDDFTHDLVFYSPNKADIGKMYSGMLNQSSDMMLLGATLDKAIKGVASYLGKSLITTPPNPAHRYANVYEMSVKDPASYAAAYSTFSAAVVTKMGGKVSMALHQFLSGNEPDATHVVVLSAGSVTDLLDAADTIYSSKEFADYNAKVKDNRSILRTFTTVNAKMYNLPEGM